MISTPIEKLSDIRNYRIIEYMKTTVSVTKRGVLTLPARLRKELGLTGDDLLIAETTPDGILLKPAVALPIEIYSDERVKAFDREEDDLAEFLSSPG